MSIRFLAISAVSLMMAASGCGGSGNNSGTPVNATATFYNGASTAAHLALAKRADSAKRNSVARLSVPVDGIWRLSPSKVILTITSIALVQGGSSSPVSVNCPVTYDASQPGLAKLLDCPFTTTTGTYTGITIGFNTTYQVLVDDPAGFYSTSTGIVTSPPGGGAQMLNVTTASQDAANGTTITFPSPLNVTGDVSLSVVLGGIQFLNVGVASGVVSIGSLIDPGYPALNVAVNSLAKLAYYTNAAVNTAGSYCSGGNCGGSPPAQGIISALVFYTDATTPYSLGFYLNGEVDNCPPLSSLGAFDIAGAGYLGLDGSNTLGWALGISAAGSSTISTYTSEFSMLQQSTVGGTTTLYCKTISADPAPSGGTFASGAPNISGSATVSVPMVLVAN